MCKDMDTFGMAYLYRGVLYSLTDKGLFVESKRSSQFVEFSQVNRVNLTFKSDDSSVCSIIAGKTNVKIRGGGVRRSSFPRFIENLHTNLKPYKKNISFRRGGFSPFVIFLVGFFACALLTILGFDWSFLSRGMIGTQAGWLAAVVLVFGLEFSCRMLSALVKNFPRKYRPFTIDRLFWFELA